ncbi:MAG: TPM domain-containing protein [Flavobacteriia bacterium]|nr:TPM domain-containing protein [Candidatus Bostrichicola ureolyticus]
MSSLFKLLITIELLDLALITPTVNDYYYDIPTPSKKIYPVNDYVGILSKKEILILNKKLIQIKKKFYSEILIVIINNIFNDNHNLIASNWGQKWKIGKKGKDNGIIILLIPKRKKISMQIGYGLEPYLTDALCKKMINNILPIYNNNYYQTLNKLIDNITIIFI